MATAGTQIDPTFTAEAARPVGSTSGTPSFAGSTVTVGTTATLINAAATDARMLSNVGTVTVFVAPTNAVTTTAGYPIPVGGSLPVTWNSATYGIVASGTGTIGVLRAA